MRDTIILGLIVVSLETLDEWTWVSPTWRWVSFVTRLLATVGMLSELHHWRVSRPRDEIPRARRVLR